MRQLEPNMDPWDFENLQKRIIDFQREMGVDVHARMLFFNPNEPIFAHFDLLNFQTQTLDWQVEIEEEKNGATTHYHHTITTPEGILTQTFSINENRKGIFMYGGTKVPIETEEDLRIAMKYEPPYSQEIKDKMKENVSKIREYLGDDGIISAWANGGLFSNLSGIIDQTELYALFLTEPEFYEDLMKFAKKRVYDYTDAVINAGVDAVCVRGNAAGGFLGNACFEEYVLPFEKDYINYCQSKGIPVIYHNCGTVMQLLPSYRKLGAKNIEPFSPHPLGDADLNSLLLNFDNEFSVTSGVDQVNILQNGTVEDVQKATKSAMEKGKKFKNFIMQNVDFLEYGTPIENIKEYARTALSNREF